MKKIILASASPRRKNLLKEAGILFITEESDYKENMNLKMSHIELAKFLSRGKAEAVAEKHKDEDVIIIGADTFVVLDNKVLGKPQTVEKAKETIKKMSGKSHLVITGFTIIDIKSNKIISRAEKTKVYFRKLTDKEIDYYVNSSNVLDKARGCAVEEAGSFLVKKIEGDYTSVIGLPMPLLIKELNKLIK